jgi:hypothetical protein
VQGYVVRADDGSPVANATIDVVHGPGPVPELPVTTNSAGSFAVPGLREGQWVLAARSPVGRGQASVHVFDSAVSDVTIEVAGSRRVVNRGRGGAERRMQGRVRGRVVRAGSGEPIEDAAITIVRGAGPAPDISPLTDAGGWFALDDLPAGDWLLRAHAPGGESGEAMARVAATSVTEVTIEIDTAAASP